MYSSQWSSKCFNLFYKRNTTQVMLPGMSVNISALLYGKMPHFGCCSFKWKLKHFIFPQLLSVWIGYLHWSSCLVLVDLHIWLPLWCHKRKELLTVLRYTWIMGWMSEKLSLGGFCPIWVNVLYYIHRFVRCELLLTPTSHHSLFTLFNYKH